MSRRFAFGVAIAAVLFFGWAFGLPAPLSGGYECPPEGCPAVEPSPSPSPMSSEEAAIVRHRVDGAP